MYIKKSVIILAAIISLASLNLFSRPLPHFAIATKILEKYQKISDEFDMRERILQAVEELGYPRDDSEVIAAVELAIRNYNRRLVQKNELNAHFLAGLGEVLEKIEKGIPIKPAKS